MCGISSSAHEIGCDCGNTCNSIIVFDPRQSEKFANVLALKLGGEEYASGFVPFSILLHVCYKKVQAPSIAIRALNTTVIGLRDSFTVEMITTRTITS